MNDIINHSDRAYDWRMVLLNAVRYADPFFPRRICISVTDWCNRKCSYCPVGVFGTKKGMISDKVFQKFAERLAEIRWNGWASLGGYAEPASVKNLDEYVRTIKATCPTCLPVVWTNGDYLTPDFTRRLLAAGTHLFIVSRHKPFSEAWDKKILECVDVAGKRMTVRGLPDWAIINQGGLTNVPFPPKKWCHLPSNSLEIGSDGTVLMCDADFKREQPRGNIMDQSIREIWYNWEFTRRRFKLLLGKPETGACRRCMAGKS